MSYNREDYDDYIPAGQLEVGDKLHLTFIGGDEYVYIDEVLVDGDQITWKAQFYAELSDTLPASEKIWIKKRA